MKKTWYREGAVYQIYPRSFKDSNNDGIGDIQGIIEKLDYIKELGASTVWVSPIYVSPMCDNGYDVADYYNIQPEYGTMEDFEHLVQEMHNRNLKLIMDLVINHTSNQHKWFLDAKKSKKSPYHDYYIWKDKPNNWTGFFGLDAWEYNQETNEYYLHLFTKEQPDLNWDNPKVRKEIKDMIRYWLDLGVDGFRCDVINLLSKTPGLPKGVKNLILVGREHFINGPKIHEYLYELKKEVFDKYDCFTVGECTFVDPQLALSYIEQEKELHMLFQFNHMGADNFLVKWFTRKFKPIRLKKPLSKWQNEINGRGWNTLYFENHDQPRSVSRFGDINYHYESATLLATMLFFQQGTPFIYQGQEIGMTNAHFTSIDEYSDVETLNVYRIGKKYLGSKNMMRRIKRVSRDNARTPMQWDDTRNGGFSYAEPWLEVNPNYQEINVFKNINEEKSIFHYYQKILKIRKNYEVVVYGDYVEKYNMHKKLVYYERNYEGKQVVIICNFSNRNLKFKPLHDLNAYELLLQNYEIIDNEMLKPFEARVYIK